MSNPLLAVLTVTRLKIEFNIRARCEMPAVKLSFFKIMSSDGVQWPG